MKRRYLKMVKLAMRSLRHPRLRHRRWWQVVTKPISNRALWIPCRDTVAAGLAIGLFFAMIPMPFQMVPSAILSMRAKANVPFAMAACWITNPITMGPVFLGQYWLGTWFIHTLGVKMPEFLSKASFHDVPKIGDVNAACFILGVIASAVICALLAYPIVHLFSAIMPHHLPVRRRKKETQPLDPAAEI
jgi:uncharacterized protein